MYRDFEIHKRSDKAKWIITAIAFVLVFILLAGICMQLFMPDGSKPADWFNKEEKPTEEQDQGGLEVEPATEQGIALASRSIPRRMYAASGISEQAENAYTVTATIAPETVLERNVVWTVTWKDSNDAWAADKRVEDYVSLTTPSNLVANISCLHPFGEKIVLTCASKVNPSVNATCNVEYIRKLSYVTFSSTVDGNKLMLNSKGDPSDVRYRAPLVGTTFLNNGVLNITEENVKQASNFTFTPSYGAVYTKEDMAVSYEMEMRLAPAFAAYLAETFDWVDSSIYYSFTVSSTDATSYFVPFACLFLSGEHGPFNLWSELSDYIALNNAMYNFNGIYFICEIRATTKAGATYSSGEIPVTIDREFVDLGPTEINLDKATVVF